MNIGVLCPSEIAFRRFLPSLKKNKSFQYIGVAIAGEGEWCIDSQFIESYILKNMIDNEQKKALKFQEMFGGKIYNSYKEMICDSKIDAIYMPLPPALHYKWAKFALENNKHVFLEKPSTTNFLESKKLVSLAKENNLALHENYMFVFHDQLKDITRIISDDKLGDIREFRISFGFPKRKNDDFRYNKKLGGGALFDCGGYTIKYASMLLGEDAKLVYADLKYLNDFNVDICGCGVMKNHEGLSAFISFGMDNSYKCTLEIWGSKGSLISERILTAPSGYIPNALVNIDGKITKIQLSTDDTFLKSIDYFYNCINNHKTRLESFENIIKQANYISEFLKLSEIKSTC